MSIDTSGSSYMSTATIMAWMATKTDNLYKKMETAMDASNSRTNAEDALNDVKAKIDELKGSDADADELRQQINDTIDKYGADFPEVAEVLQPIADELTARYEANQPKAMTADTAPNELAGDRHPNTEAGDSGGDRSGGSIGSQSGSPASESGKDENVGEKKLSDDPKVEFPPVKVSSEDAERWTSHIKDKVDTLSKADQLGLIYIQDFNSQINRAQDAASALVASANKAADNTVAHIG